MSALIDCTGRAEGIRLKGWKKGKDGEGDPRYLRAATEAMPSYRWFNDG